jgi:hypothetical protein
MMGNCFQISGRLFRFFFGFCIFALATQHTKNWRLYDCVCYDCVNKLPLVENRFFFHMHPNKNILFYFISSKIKKRITLPKITDESDFSCIHMPWEIIAVKPKKGCKRKKKSIIQFITFDSDDIDKIGVTIQHWHLICKCSWLSSAHPVKR